MSTKMPRKELEEYRRKYHQLKRKFKSTAKMRKKLNNLSVSNGRYRQVNRDLKKLVDGKGEFIEKKLFDEMETKYKKGVIDLNDTINTLLEDHNATCKDYNDLLGRVIRDSDRVIDAQDTAIKAVDSLKSSSVENERLKAKLKQEISWKNLLGATLMGLVTLNIIVMIFQELFIK